MSRGPVVAVAAVVTLTAVLFGGATAVAAQEGPDASVGWWSRNPAQSAPENGFAVASAPDGPVTVAAVVLDLGAGITGGSLSAAETGGLGQGVADIVVCPAVAPVALPDGGSGDLDDAPEPDCDRGAVPFERDPDSLRWSADLSPLAVDVSGEISLVLVPAPGDAPLDPTFDVRFDAPEVDLALVPAETAPQPAAPTQAPDPSAPPSRSNDSFDTPPPARAPNVVPPAVIDIPDAPDPVEQSPTATPSADPVEADDDAEEASAPIRPVGEISSGHGPQVAKAAIFVLVSALAGALVTGASRVARTRQFGS